MEFQAESFRHISFPKELCDRIKTSFLYFGRGVRSAGLKDLAARYAFLLLVSDRTIWDSTASLVDSDLPETTDFLVFDGPVHCDQAGLETVLGRLDGHDCVLALGSGTVNDLCRLAAHQRGLPFWSVGTAPSMDGYLSANSSVIRGGIKISFPNITPPEGVIIDPDLLETAPVRMLIAGIGDSLAKITSLFDWKLDTLDTPGNYDPVLYGLLQRAVDSLLDILENQEDQALGAVSEFLLLSGAVMQAHRSSQPASGGEHLVSHIWEMFEQKGLIPAAGLHGEKAGLAFFHVLRYYCRYLEKPGPALADAGRKIRRNFPEWEKWNVQPDRNIIDEKIRKLAGREFPLSAMKDAAETLGKRFSRVTKVFDKYLIPRKAGDLGIPDEAVRFAFLHGGEIRTRCTCMDWIHFSGAGEDLSSFSDRS